MIHLAKPSLLGGAIVAALLVVGCQKKPTRPPIDRSAIVGKWVEVVENGPRNPRMAPRQPSPFVRHLAISADNTFVFSLHRKSGEATKHKIEGTWVVERGVLVFKVTGSTLEEGDERSAWTPESSDGVFKRDIAGQGVIEVLPIIDLEGMMIDYKRES